jgi:hypothetical protein
MRRKVIVVALVFWIISVIGGATWGRLEQYFHQRAIPPGQVEINDLRDLYKARLFDEVLAECQRAERNAIYLDCEPQIMYIRWATHRRLGRFEDAEHDKEAFIGRFSMHPLAADMHFSTAMDSLAAEDYQMAEQEMNIVQNKFGSTMAAKRSRNILRHLHVAEKLPPIYQAPKE